MKQLLLTPLMRFKNYLNMKGQLGLVLMLLVAVCRSQVKTGEPQVYYPRLTDPCVGRSMKLINEYYRSIDDYAPRVPVQVIHATYQVVEGTQYKMTLIVSSGNQEEKCIVEYLYKKWLINSVIPTSPVMCWPFFRIEDPL